MSGRIATAFRAVLHRRALVALAAIGAVPRRGRIGVRDPYAVLALADRRIVADAGANAILSVDAAGTVSLLAVIPKNGKQQAVPTSLALGPDGAVYVGELALGAGKNKARIWRVPLDGTPPTVFAGGFTTITGLAFAPDARSTSAS